MADINIAPLKTLVTELRQIGDQVSLESAAAFIEKMVTLAIKIGQPYTYDNPNYDPTQPISGDNPKTITTQLTLEQANALLTLLLANYTTGMASQLTLANFTRTDINKANQIEISLAPTTIGAGFSFNTLNATYESQSQYFEAKIGTVGVIGSAVTAMLDTFKGVFQSDDRVALLNQLKSSFDSIIQPVSGQ